MSAPILSSSSLRQKPSCSASPTLATDATRTSPAAGAPRHSRHGTSARRGAWQSERDADGLAQALRPQRLAGRRRPLAPVRNQHGARVSNERLASRFPDARAPQASAGHCLEEFIMSAVTTMSRSAETAAYGGLIDALGGIAAAVLAIIGLTGFDPQG